MKNKIILSILIVVGLFSCTEEKERSYLQQIDESLKREYELYKSRISAAVKDSEPMNDEVKSRMLHVDSLYQVAANGIEDATSATAAETELKDFYRSVIDDLNIEIKDSIESLPTNFYQQYGKVKLNLLGKRALDRLALEIDAQELRFDELKIFVESSETDPNSAKVYLAAYSSNTDKIMKMYANDNEIEIVNGIGQLQLKNDQVKDLNIKIKSTSNNHYWKDWSMEKVIEK
ncbi:MAG: hypothetical protein AAGE93_08930 [Bacteroidota bacterium]